MDPDAALQELRDVFEDPDAVTDPEIALELYEQAATLFAGLDGWLSKGGFPPKDWKHGNNDTTGA